MKTEGLVWKEGRWKHTSGDTIGADEAHLVLVFGDFDAIAADGFRESLNVVYPKAHIAGGTTAGTIETASVSENPLIATVVAFEKGWIRLAVTDNLENATLEQRAQELIGQLPKEELQHVFILMEGLGGLDASRLIKGINKLEKGLYVTGGLVGDGGRFEKTLVFGDGAPKERSAVAIGFYGASLHARIGCETGWEEFGTERVVTRSDGNVIYEIDNQPAFKLYEEYLGEFVHDLPASGLRFPLSLSRYEGDKGVVRVMMGINPDKSIIFAGDVPQGSIVRLMKTNVTNLVDGAELSAKMIERYNDKTALAIAVSCTGRRTILKQLVDSELEAVQMELGENTHICGFYSYGEIAPFSDDLINCKLHNQTMTITAIYED